MFFDNPMLFELAAQELLRRSRTRSPLRRTAGKREFIGSSVGFGMRRLVPCRFQVEDASCWPAAMKEQALQRRCRTTEWLRFSSSTVCQATRPWRTSPLRLWVGALEIPAIATIVRPSQKCCMST